jgi:acyl carrier protein
MKTTLGETSVKASSEKEATSLEERIAREIVRIAREELHIAEPTAEGIPLAHLLDSLALLSLVVAVEDRFHVILQDDDAARVKTLEDLARLVAARAPRELWP